MLARLIGPVRTRDLMFTGRTLSAQRGRRTGAWSPGSSRTTSCSTPPVTCSPSAAGRHPAARSVVKSSLDNYLGLFDRIGMQASYSSPEALEGFRAFKERRSPEWVHPELRIDGSPSTIVQPFLNTDSAVLSCVMQTVTHSDALSRFGCALSDPTRAEILLMLREAPGYPSELAEKIGVTRQILSNHLACLRGCGLVVAEPEGRRSRYRLADERIGARARRPDRAGAHRRPGLLPRRRSRRLLLMTAPAGVPARRACPPHPPAGRRDDHLQRRRGDRRVGRGHPGVVDGVGRIRSGLGDRGFVGGRSRVAVLGEGSRRRGRRPRCGSSRSRSSRSPPTSPSTPCCRCSDLARRARRRSASRWRPQASSSCRCCRWRSAARVGSWDRPRPLPIRSRHCCAPICRRYCWRACCSTHRRLVVGGSGRRVGHRGDRGSRRPQRLARRPVLLIDRLGRTRHTLSVTRTLRGVLRTRIRLAQLGTAPPYGIHRISRDHRPPGFGRVVGRSRVRSGDGCGASSRRSCS